jgi:hypothetical protein
MAVDHALAEVLPRLSESGGGEISDLLVEITAQGLRRMREVVNWEVDKGDVQLTRLITDSAMGASKLLARINEAHMRHETRRDLIDQLQAQIREIEAKR